MNLEFQGIGIENISAKEVQQSASIKQTALELIPINIKQTNWRREINIPQMKDSMSKDELKQGEKEI